MAVTFSNLPIPSFSCPDDSWSQFRKTETCRTSQKIRKAKWRSPETRSSRQTPFVALTSTSTTKCSTLVSKFWTSQRRLSRPPTSPTTNGARRWFATWATSLNLSKAKSESFDLRQWALQYSLFRECHQSSQLRLTDLGATEIDDPLTSIRFAVINKNSSQTLIRELILRKIYLNLTLNFVQWNTYLKSFNLVLEIPCRIFVIC
jgi:hypothetical protein